MSANYYSTSRTNGTKNGNTSNNVGNNTENSTGMLTVQAYIADRAIPIEGANVIISRQNDSGGEDLIKILKTDASGSTETVELPAPPAKNSLSPNSRVKYYKYNIRVDYPGYYTIENIDVPLFAGSKSIQPVAMLPLPDGEEKGKRITIVEEEPQDLQ